MTIRVLVVPGATRTEAFSKKLARACGKLVEQAGAQATVIDLRDFAMPLYDGDLEAQEGVPEGAVRLRGVVKQHEALMFCSPEYNSSIPAVLKNTIDWLSRPYQAEPGVSAFKGKTAAVMSSSPGALGGLRGLVHLRQILMNLGVLVITEQFALGNAGSAFAADGSLADARQSATVLGIAQRLVHVASRLIG
ncbi:MAG TPA: NAD(P)H-dependent oxidoreductase [Planctomycetota bacterium]